jgi:hypothetical protein
MPIQIGSDVFAVPPPRGMKSFALQQRILPIAGQIARVFLHLLDLKGDDVEKLLDTDVKQLFALVPVALPAIGGIFSSMPPGELDAITREMLGEATYVLNGKGKPLRLFGAGGDDAFDLVMRGRAIDTWKLLWHALEVWYPDFFALGARRREDAREESPSPSPAT